MRQDAILFEDTLKNNITMYQDVSDEEVIALLSKVGGIVSKLEFTKEYSYKSMEILSKEEWA